MARPLARRLATALGYGLLGLLGTAAVGFGTLLAIQPAARSIYGLVYLQLGPSDATKFAVLLSFVLAGSVALAAVTLAGEYLSNRGTNRRAVLLGLGAVGLLDVAYVALSLAGLVGVVVALGWILSVGIAVPLLVAYRYDVRSGAVPAFVGGVPVVVFLLLLAGVGIGWGWGYVVVAEEVPATSTGGNVTTVDAVPQVRDDLFAGDCETLDGRETCYLSLRGYEHELAATHFLADHGVRCPYQGSGPSSGAFVARHGDRYYRMTCAAHGD